MKKVLLSGPIYSRSGYGEHTRFVLRALLSHQEIFDIYIQPTVWGQSNWIYDKTPFNDLIKSLIQKAATFKGTFDLSLQVKIPNEWENIAAQNIGITAAIETDKCSPEWIDACNKVDKVIVTSQHSKSTIVFPKYTVVDEGGNPTGGILECTTPVEVVGYPIKQFESVDLSLNLETKFNFLTVAQFGNRKNLENLVRWFTQEFKDDKDVGLVIKCHHLNNSTVDNFDVTNRLKNLSRETPGHKCKLYLIHGNMSDEEMHELYLHDKIKAYVTTTHGEGFGLPIFEAVYSGLPVVAPAFSGHLDFLYMPLKNEKSGRVKKTPMFSKIKSELRPVQEGAVWEKVIVADSQWAFPIDSSFKKQIRNVYKTYSHKKKIAGQLQDWALREFTEERQNLKMVQAILADEYNTLKVESDELPTISVLTSVYNGDDHIEEFLKDMSRQTIFEDKVELILVNAASPGNEKEIIEKYRKQYPNNIKYFELEEDPGIYGTWNFALSQATGEYITNANLDDRKAPHSLERHAKELATNDHVGLVYADSFITHGSNEIFEDNTSEGNRYNFEQFSKEAMLRGNQPHNNPMWRRSLHDDHGEFDSQYKSAGDWEFFLRCAFNGEEFKKINEVLGLYYHNPSGVSTNPDNFSWKRKEERSIYLKYKKAAEEEIII